MDEAVTEESSLRVLRIWNFEAKTVSSLSSRGKTITHYVFGTVCTVIPTLFRTWYFSVCSYFVGELDCGTTPPGSGSGRQCQLMDSTSLVHYRSCQITFALYGRGGWSRLAQGWEHVVVGFASCTLPPRVFAGDVNIELHAHGCKGQGDPSRCGQ